MKRPLNKREVERYILDLQAANQALLEQNADLVFQVATLETENAALKTQVAVLEDDKVFIQDNSDVASFRNATVPQIAAAFNLDELSGNNKDRIIKILKILRALVLNAYPEA